MRITTLLGQDPQLMVTTLEVLLGSFALGLITFLGIDRLNRDQRTRHKPDIDAYVDQMLAANGTHLNMRRVIE